MSEEFVRKQMYACTRCRKIFETKEEVLAHYRDVHEFGEKYSGKYFVSKDENDKIVGRVCNLLDNPNACLALEMFAIDATQNSTYTTNPRAKIPPWYEGSVAISTNQSVTYMTPEDFEKRFKIVTPEVAKEYLNLLLIKVGYTMLAHDSRFNNFRDLLEDKEYRYKGDDNGN